VNEAFPGNTLNMRRHLPLLAICLGYFMVILDATIVNVALPSIGREPGDGVSALQWVVDAYTVVFAGLLLSAGSLGDLLGARRVFDAGLALFTAASAACALSPSVALLIAARAVQGLGAALLVPSSLALLRAAYSDAASRARAVGAWGRSPASAPRPGRSWAACWSG
jgi:MFS transporter, DHA2 family, methylenomycin A resistance protein